MYALINSIHAGSQIDVHVDAAHGVCALEGSSWLFRIRPLSTDSFYLLVAPTMHFSLKVTS